MLSAINRFARLLSLRAIYRTALRQREFLPQAMVVGKHHKTGTAYANAVFREIASLLRYDYIRLNSKSDPLDIELRPETVYMCSQFAAALHCAL